MSRILSVSVPDELIARAEALAEIQGKTKSEVVRDALRRHLELQRMRELQRYASRQAEQRGVGPEDVEALTDEVRGQGR